MAYKERPENLTACSVCGVFVYVPVPVEAKGHMSGFLGGCLSLFFPSKFSPDLKFSDSARLAGHHGSYPTSTLL